MSQLQLALEGPQGHALHTEAVIVRNQLLDHDWVIDPTANLSGAEIRQLRIRLVTDKDFTEIS